MLHAKIRQATGPAAADIAVTVYDLDEVAARLAATADYDGLTAIIAAEVTPTAVTAVRPVELSQMNQLPEIAATTAVTPVDDVEPVLLADLFPAPGTVGQTATVEPVAKPKRTRRPKPATPKKPGRPSVEAKVVAAFTRNPAADVKRLARRLGVSERTIQRYRPRPVEPVTTTPNGSVPA
ncbi:hypothetical protein RB614_37850 [Phytohabitans sp. ZYX-F-186]|uniref:Resolvase HTH domain-containing protein n=1 Tax=Phytohabitans maris TaxID=3071409 RepID=A0ABU0ZTB1_9ACTN|nr:hypothetical protein [Phytohabitans sp. ZYX-F-186]MDQ7910274.1 hypothetical protein [Phytohabitans sp. ZYX-F-186]